MAHSRTFLVRNATVKTSLLVKTQFLTVVTMRITVLWEMVPCSLVGLFISQFSIQAKNNSHCLEILSNSPICSLRARIRALKFPMSAPFLPRSG
jgi:hypothetical protein